MADLPRVNLHELVPEYDADDPEGYRAGMARFGPSIGASQMGASLYELPPGQSICPYHYEYPEEEWLVVLSGRVLLRHPGGEQELGDIDTSDLFTEISRSIDKHLWFVEAHLQA